MIITTLIATIIHMHMGFELGEAIARGFGSACLVAAILFVLYLAFVIASGLKK